MPLTRPQVELFCLDLAELFSIRPPRISHRPRIRCRWKKRTLHLGRKINRSELAHELAHYIQRELIRELPSGRFAKDPNAAVVVHGSEYVKRGGRLHGARFRAWERLIGNYIAQEFGEGEGVIL